jgi:hypothetical protein
MNQYEMSEEEKQAEAQSWKRWKSPETWGNTDSGAHTHGWVSGRNYALAAAEAQRNALAAENARLREGLAFYADESNYDDSVQTVSPEMPGLGPIHYYAPSIAEDRGERARALLTQEESGDVLNR